MKIKIEYLQDTREALLSTDELGKSWNAIIRACLDNAGTNQVELEDAFSIRLPWWSFLLARESIGYHISSAKSSVDFSDSAKAFLKSAQERKNSYERGIQAAQITQIELDAFLSKEGFARPLTTHQKRNVRKLAALSSGATFSVPGAGKTTEALAFFCCQKTENTKLLIICPKNAFAVWEEQIGAIFPTKNIKIDRLVGGKQNIKNALEQIPDVSLITYHQLPTAENEIANFMLANEVFVFLDESHKMKKGDSGRIGSTLLSLAHLPQVKCIMSGTPMPNKIDDLIPQFRFLYPEISTTIENVQDLIKPVYVRTNKKELDIPELTRVSVPIPLSPAQRTLYTLLCSEIARENNITLSAFDRRKLRALGKSALTLIQLVSNPTLLARRALFEHKDLLNAVLAEGDSPKLEYVTWRARQLAAEGKKTIIWSGFVQNVELISSRLQDIGADFIHGGVEAGSEDEENTRERKIKRFHDDKKAFVLVANPAACAEGISLHTVCHNAIYVDRNYNAAQYLQSEDRIHRLGLKPGQETLVEILCSPNTVDEAVTSRLIAKVSLMAQILEDPDLTVQPTVNFDPESNEVFDIEDAISFINHLKAEIA